MSEPMSEEEFIEAGRARAAEAMAKLPKETQDALLWRISSGHIPRPIGSRCPACGNDLEEGANGQSVMNPALVDPDPPSLRAFKCEAGHFVTVQDIEP